MGIIFHESERIFHLYNREMSCIIAILEQGVPVNLYFGKRIRDNSFSHLMRKEKRAMAVVFDDAHSDLSLEHLRQEYPVYGTGDMRYPAIEIEAENGSRLLDLKYVSHRIFAGKEDIMHMPAVYTEDDTEANSLYIDLKDEKTGLKVTLKYAVDSRGIISCGILHFLGEIPVGSSHRPDVGHTIKIPIWQET